MKLAYGSLNAANLQRLVLLISNQFNLVTWRYAQEELAAIIQDDVSAGIWFRLTDCSGDNGLKTVDGLIACLVSIEESIQDLNG